MSTPSCSSRSYARNRTGTLSRIAGVSFLRPMRCCRSANGRHRAVAPRDELAIEHHAIGQRCRRGDDLRKALGDEILAARPDEALRLPRRMSWPRMPSHFHSICQFAGAPSALDVAFERRGEIERIRRGRIGRGRSPDVSAFPERRRPAATRPSADARHRRVELPALPLARASPAARTRPRAARRSAAC